MPGTTIQIKSKQQLMSDKIATIKANTDITDFSDGSAVLTLAESATSADLSLEGRVLRLLKARNIDAISGAELVTLAKEVGLNPAHIGSSPSTATLTIGDSAFAKVSSTIYAGATAPIAGNQTLKIVSGTGFGASGTIYIGRNTSSYESISYTSIANSGAGYWTITLASPLVKDHLVGEEVIYAQGGDRPINAGTVVRVPSSTGNSQIQFSIVNGYTLLDGESSLTGVIAICTQSGSQGRIGANRIKEFVSLPWSTATVTNPNPTTGGTDPEDDASLRQRIKDYAHNLTRGTKRALQQGVKNLTDPDENKTITSAYLVSPSAPGEYSKLFIDDGSDTGYQPSFSGVGEEDIVLSAIGIEQDFQVQQYPVAKPQLATLNQEPFNISGGETLAIETDGTIEQQTFSADSFQITGQATAQELAQAINKLFGSIEARAKDGTLFIVSTADDPDYLEVISPSSGTDANTYLSFPANRAYMLRLYRNGVLQSKNGQLATLTSKASSQWPAFTSPQTLQLSIDGIDGPTISLTDSDFASLTSSNTIAAASASDWATIMPLKFIGISAQVNTDGTFSIFSNKGKSSSAKLSILSGSLSGNLFDSTASSTGGPSQYTFNRLTGKGTLATKLSAGEVLQIGTSDTRGFALTAAQQTFNLPTTNGLAAQMVMVADYPATLLALSQAGSLTFTSSSGIQTIQQTNATYGPNYFSKLQEGDWVHLFNLSRNALLKVYRVYTTTYTDDTIDLFDPNPQTGTNSLDNASNLISAFRTDGKPQLVTLPSGSAVTNSALVTSINSQVESIEASVQTSGAVKIETLRYADGGALSIPVITWSAKQNLGITAGAFTSNEPQAASIESDDLAGLPTQKLTINTPDLVAPYDQLNVTGTPFSDYTYAGKGILDYFGAGTLSFRQPQIRQSTSLMTLRDDAPAPWVELGVDALMALTANIELGESDNIIFLIDNNPSQKTFDVPLYVTATIAGPSTPSTTQWDATDSVGNLLGTSSAWSGYRFEDYRVWFQARTDLTNSFAANGALRIQAVHYGPIGKKLQFGFFYPTSGGQSGQALWSIDTTNALVNLQYFLASQTALSIGTSAGQYVYVDVSGVAAPYTYKFQFSSPVNLSSVDTTNFCVNATGSEFNTNNTLPIKITAVSDLNDSTKTFSTSGSSTTVTISANPSFTVAIGDVIQAGGNTVRITAVASQTSVTVNTAVNWPAATTGTVSRIYVQGTRPTNGSGSVAEGTAQNETTTPVTLLSPTSIQIYQVGGETAATILANINATAGIKDQITASNAPSSTGVGLVGKSTEDEIGSGSKYQGLQNGESFVYSTSGTSPAIRLKEATDFAPSIGDSILLIPMTAVNLYDHFSSKQVSGLTTAADVALVNNGRKVQVSTKSVGGAGQVAVIGGKGNGNSALNLRNTAQAISSSYGLLELDSSALTLLAPNQKIKISQTSRAAKSYISPGPSDTIATSFNATGNVVTATTSFNLTNVYSYTHTGTVIWRVSRLSRGRLRFGIYSGTATIPASLAAGDWVFVGDGSTTYSGSTPASFFLPANTGWFQVRETDNSTYFDVDATGAEQIVSATSAPFIFCAYNSTRPGDQISLGANVPLVAGNRGTYTIVSVPTATTATWVNANGSTQSAQTLGSLGSTAIQVLDQGYSTYRTVVLVSPKPTDPTNRCYALVNPGTNLGLLSESQGGSVALQNRLGYSTTPVNGINGYEYWIGLKQRAQRTLDGWAIDPINFQGYAAEGTFVEARESQIQQIIIAMTITTSDGVALTSISDDIKSRISGYINNLPLGSDVILGDIYSAVQAVPGVESCVLTTPSPSLDRIAVGRFARPKISPSNITLS